VSIFFRSASSPSSPIDRRPSPMSEEEEAGDGAEYDGDDYGDSDGEMAPDEGTDLTNLMLEDDMAEVQDRGYFVGRDNNRIECSVWIGFPLSQLSKDVLFACGLDHSKSVAVKLVFTDPPVYGSRCPGAKDKHIFIRQTAKRDFSNLGLSECEFFGLWWTLEQRLSEYLHSEWRAISAAQQKRVERIREREKHASSKKVAHLAEIHAVRREVARLALVRSNNHLDCATDLLCDERRKRELLAEVAQEAMTVRESDNLLLLCLKCIRHRIEECTRFCLVCDKPHPVQLLKPTVCSQDLCNFQFTNMGLGINVENEILKSPQACDLLISMTTGASFSGRFFEPFPTVEAVVQDATTGEGVKLSFDRNKPREVSDVLQKCPSIQKMTEMVKRGTLREELEILHPLLYKLLRWIMGTNRCHLHFITDSSMRVEGVQTDLQFILRSTPPEKERVFKQLKHEHPGTFYTFHGSGLGNWHSILRMGLKSFSGTEKQSHGAVYGPGIYMAVDAATAMFYAGYGHVGQGWQHSQFGPQVKCIALCEVVNHGDGDGKHCGGQLHRPKCKHSTSSPHYRVEMEELVVTRYLFLYPTKMGNVAIQAKDLKVPKNATV